MKLAIMQPYFFPYLGYYQLVYSVDKFISYDDVNFIKQGWINRNRILICGRPQYFTVPIKNLSSFTRINETKIDNEKWKIKFLKSVQQSYAKANYFKDVFALLESVLSDSHAVISTLALSSIKAVSYYLNFKTEIVHSSTIYHNDHLNGIERVLNICQLEKAKLYMNLSGGIDLYPKARFAEKNIQLAFLQTKQINYPQNSAEFIPNLSMIDVLMHNSKDKVKQLLSEFKLL